IAAIGYNCMPMVWDAATSKLLYKIHTVDLPRSCTFSPDSSLLVTSGNDEDGYIDCWDAATGTVQQCIPLAGDQDDDPKVATFSHDGKQLALSDLCPWQVVNSIRLCDIEN